MTEKNSPDHNSNQHINNTKQDQSCLHNTSDDGSSNKIQLETGQGQQSRAESLTHFCIIYHIDLHQSPNFCESYYNLYAALLFFFCFYFKCHYIIHTCILCTSVIYLPPPLPKAIICCNFILLLFLF